MAGTLHCATSKNRLKWVEMDATNRYMGLWQTMTEEKEDKPTKDVEVVDGEELVDGVAADKEGDELVAWLLVSLDHQPLLPETSK